MARPYRDRLYDVEKPDYYLWPLRRPHPVHEPLIALAFDQTEHWQTSAEWLAWLRRTGRPYKVWSKLTRGKWVPQSRPIIKAHWRPWSTLKHGYLPDGKRAELFASRRLASDSPHA